MNKFRNILLGLIIVLTLVLFIRNGKNLHILPKNYDLNDVKEVKYAMPYGNPEKGMDCKSIKGEELEELLNILQSAKIGQEVNKEDLQESSPSRLFFYNQRGETILMNPMVLFNGIDDSKVSYKGGYYYVDYPENMRSPYEIYQDSEAEEFTIMEKELFE